MTQTKEPKRILGLRKSAIVEVAIFFVAMLVLDIVFGGANRFWGVSPHPFWIIVLLISCQYGTSEGLMSSVLASLVLLLGNVPEQSVSQDTYAYMLHVTANPLMWITASLALGELRQKHIRERALLNTKLEEARTREETIANAYDRLKELKEMMELRIAGQLRSSIDTYKAARAIEKLHPMDVLRGVEELVRAVINPERFSVYTLTPKGLETSITCGWTDGATHPAHYDTNSPLYNEVIGRQHVICSVNSDHEKILGENGVLAGPLINRETGEVTGMLKIERLGFLDLNLSTIETFSALCEWIGMSFVNARHYQVVKAESVVNPDHNLMSSSYFRRYTDYITKLAQRVSFDVTMIIVKLANASTLAEEQRTQVAIALGDAVNKTLRSVDLAFDHQQTGEEYAIVMPATDTAGAKIVLDKIMKGLQERSRKGTKGAHFSYTVHSLHAKPAK